MVGACASAFSSVRDLSLSTPVDVLQHELPNVGVNCGRTDSWAYGPQIYFQRLYWSYERLVSQWLYFHGSGGSFRWAHNRQSKLQDPILDQTFAKQLRLTCPTNTTVKTTNLDIRSPNVFDTKYYVDLLNRQTLFTSDQTLYSDSRTRDVV
ncbi:peroxidase 12-like [Cryptomeria japonica]|uniref:peroxidase 12-like n=1 Tax=Cryptomeria japonica TaxID=3369 RepID=UPI0025AB7C45|nr:peroxidase 12-like [Cryptomeria japonica]